MFREFAPSEFYVGEREAPRGEARRLALAGRGGRTSSGAGLATTDAKSLRDYFQKGDNGQKGSQPRRQAIAGHAPPYVVVVVALNIHF